MTDDRAMEVRACTPFGTGRGQQLCHNNFKDLLCIQSLMPLGISQTTRGLPSSTIIR